MTSDKSLEDYVNQDFSKKDQPVKRWLVDTASLVSFSIPAGMTIDIFASGMTIDESCMSRAVAIPINMVFGGLQGAYTDLVRKKIFNVKKNSSWFKKRLADFFAFGSFQSFLYSGILGITSFFYPIESEQILKGTGLVFTSSLLVGNLFGYYLDSMRDIFHTKTYYDTLEEKNLNNSQSYNL